MSDPDDVVEVSRDGPVALMTLNRPERLNAFDGQCVHTMWTRMAALGRDRSVRAVVLTGAGRAFCAGGDLAALMEDSPDRPGDRRAGRHDRGVRRHGGHGNGLLVLRLQPRSLPGGRETSG